MADITKFSYIKEFVDPKVRKSIDGLPFTAEGYKKAKDILIERFGNILRRNDVILLAPTKG